MKRFLFRVREFAWEVVCLFEDILYPYRNRLTPEEKYEHGMVNPVTGEIEMVELLIQANNERIERLQDEMISVFNRLHKIEEDIKSINTYSENKSDQFNLNERQESSEKNH